MDKCMNDDEAKSQDARFQVILLNHRSLVLFRKVNYQYSQKIHKGIQPALHNCLLF